MVEVAIKTHLIITDIHDEYHINWCGKLMDANPIMEKDMPIFVLRGGKKRIELNTFNIKEIEKVGKAIANPKGRQAVTSDNTYVYIKEVDGNEKLVCIITRTKVKTFASMYDKVGYEQ